MIIKKTLGIDGSHCHKVSVMSVASCSLAKREHSQLFLCAVQACCQRASSKQTFFWETLGGGGNLMNFFFICWKLHCTFCWSISCCHNLLLCPALQVLNLHLFIHKFLIIKGWGWPVSVTLIWARHEFKQKTCGRGADWSCPQVQHSCHLTQSLHAVASCRAPLTWTGAPCLPWATWHTRWARPACTASR